MKNTGKRYNEEFKTDITRMVREEKRPVSSIEKDFGVNNQTVRNWLKESKDKQYPDKKRKVALNARLRRCVIFWMYQEVAFMTGMEGDQACEKRQI